jgi:hypothetical protein
MRTLFLCLAGLVIGCSSHRNDDRPDPQRAAAIGAAKDYVHRHAPWLLARNVIGTGTQEFADHWRVDVPARSPWGRLIVEVPKAAGGKTTGYFSISLESAEELDALKHVIEQSWESRPAERLPTR